MIDDSTEWESRNGRVAARHDGTSLVLSWFRAADWSSDGDHRGVDMVRFDPSARILSIFPKVGSRSDFDEQFDQVRELQLETSVCGWDPEMPVGEGESGELELVGMPDGFGKIFAYGLGLPRAYRGIVAAVESNTDCHTVRFGAAHQEGADGDVFHVGLDRFSRYKAAVDRNRRRGTTVVGRVNSVEASNAIADLVGKAKERPSLGRHPMIQAITRAVTDETPLDTEERSALLTRMATESKQIAAETPQALGKLRNEIELVTLEVLIEQFGDGLRGSMAKDEHKWQAFFEANSFALQQLFAAPVALYGAQLHLRLPNMHGAGARIADFVLVNTLTRSAVVVEIKTPSTPLLGPRYRGAGGAEVHPPNTELSGAVAQLQAQMESAVTDFRDLLRQTRDAETAETSSVRGAIIAGSHASLGQEEKLSFLRYRDGLHGIEVLTFDEVHGRLQGLHQMLTSPRPAHI